MNRQDIYNEIEQMFGLVPGFFKMIPDSSLEPEWNLMKCIQFEEGPIPNKYRELMGVAIAAVIRLRRRPRALPVDECVTCASTLDVSKLVASADFAGGG
jgi:alkylhydroperoxidase/carboxymuconolactone decarboxylase family protein YurZ